MTTAASDVASQLKPKYDELRDELPEKIKSVASDAASQLKPKYDELRNNPSKKKQAAIFGVVIILLVAGAWLFFNRNPLVGTWVTRILGSEIEMTFRRDGTFSSRSDGQTGSGTYSVERNRVTFFSRNSGIASSGSGTLISEFEIKKNILIARIVYVEVDGLDVSFLMPSMTFTFTRK